MNWFRRHAIATGTTLALLSLLILAAPRTGHALVAALVQVTNTAAAPVITHDVSRLASQNVQLECYNISQPAYCFQILPYGDTPGFVPFYSVPAGSSLVITTVDISTTGPATVQLRQYNGGGIDRGLWTLSAAGSFQSQYPSGIVLAAGTTPVFDGPGGPFPFAAFNVAFLNGYLVSN
jgi:hypothetical protein